MSAGNPGVFVPSGARKVNASKAFDDSFGSETPDKTVISDPLGVLTGESFVARPALRKSYESEYRAIDELMEDGASFRGAMHEVAVQKGLNVDDYTLPVYPLQDLTRLTSRNTPFFDMIPQIARDSNTVEQDSVTELATPQIGGERSVPNDADDTYQPQSLSMTYYRVTGSVSGPMQLASQGFRNAMGTEQRNKQEAMTQFGANLALNGDPTTGTSDGSLTDERAFNGVLTLLKDTDSNSFGGKRAHEPDAGAGSSITSQMVRNEFRRATQDGGNPQSTVHVTDPKTVMDLKNDLDKDNETVQVSGPNGTINIGAPSVSVDGNMVVGSDFMPNTDYDSANNPDGRQLLTIDMRYLSMHNLSSTVMETLAKTDDSDQFFLKRYSVLMLAAGASKYASLLTGLP